MSAVFLGLIGTGVSWAVAGSSNVDLPPEKRVLITSNNPNYQAFYEKSYQDQVHSKRKAAAVKGGLLGTLAFVVIYASAQH